MAVCPDPQPGQQRRVEELVEPFRGEGAVERTSTWVEVSSAETRQASHLRETMSRTATATRRARLKWVKS